MKAIRPAIPFRRAALAVLASVVLTGCAHGPAFQKIEPVPADRAQLYIYRKFSWNMGSQNVHQVSIDGRAPALRLPNASWQRVLLAPGEHTVAITDYFGQRLCPPYPMVINARAGETLYIENTFQSWADAFGRGYVACPSKLQSEAEALSDLSGLKRAD